MKKLRKCQILKKLKKADGYYIDSIQLCVRISKYFDECFEEELWETKRYSFSIEQVDDVVGKLYDLSLTYHIEDISNIEDLEFGVMCLVLSPSEDYKTNINADVIQAVIDLMNKQVDKNKMRQEEKELLSTECSKLFDELGDLGMP